MIQTPVDTEVLTEVLLRNWPLIDLSQFGGFSHQSQSQHYLLQSLSSIQVNVQLDRCQTGGNENAWWTPALQRADCLQASE